MDLLLNHAKCDKEHHLPVLDQRPLRAMSLSAGLLRNSLLALKFQDTSVFTYLMCNFGQLGLH